MSTQPQPYGNWTLVLMNFFKSMSTPPPIVQWIFFLISMSMSTQPTPYSRQISLSLSLADLSLSSFLLFSSLLFSSLFFSREHCTQPPPYGNWTLVLMNFFKSMSTPPPIVQWIFFSYL
ncbi:hypothetical protein MLD38_035323 [Melastoma candidum]|uniref:Uncharacterized protein n=1 Tax=Melastoma candidum TaxID=119954 RepID=A0ACB9LI23_9MYRT|nr:hypothetical protein MLD38_035323 [Melastoma candidum]